MHINVAIHPSWLTRPQRIGTLLAALSVLERPTPETEEEYPPDPYQEDTRPEPPAPAGSATWDRGDAWEPPLGPRPSNGQAGEEDSPPADGRQLLGWASKQIPDMKGTLISFGKKKGLNSKIVAWTPQQVAAAYKYARSRLQQPQ